MSDAKTATPDMQVDMQDVELLERSEARRDGIPFFTPHWHLFIPTVVIAVLYSFAWLMLVIMGHIDSAIARLFVVVMAVGVPLLAVHAFLRYQTIRLQVSGGHFLCHPGWPKDLPIDLPAEMVIDASVRRGLSGRFFGGGTLILQLVTGDRVVIADLGEPQKALEAVNVVLGVKP